MTQRCNCDGGSHSRRISRREFLKLAAAGAAGLLAGCTSAQQPTPTPTHTPAPTATLPPTATPTGVPTATPTIAPPSTSLSQVAIAQADAYDRPLIRQQVQALLDGLGGLDDVISSGDRVAIKVNLVGGTYFQPPAGVSATESYLTPPAGGYAPTKGFGKLWRDSLAVSSGLGWGSYPRTTGTDGAVQQFERGLMLFNGLESRQIYILYIASDNRYHWLMLPDSWRPPPGILFASDRDGDDEIWVMKSDGSEQISLTVNTWMDGSPA